MIMVQHKMKSVHITEYSVEIQLENDVVLTVNSNNGYFYFTLSRVELPLKIGHQYGVPNLLETNNTFECIYNKDKNYE